MLMIRPLRRDIMCGITARLIRKVPLRFTSSTRSHAASGTSQTRRRSAPWGAAESRQRLRDEALGVGGATHVAHEREDAAPQALDLRGQALEPLPALTDL